MGRHSQFLHVGGRGSLKKLRKEILGNNKIIKKEQRSTQETTAIKSNGLSLNEKIELEEKVLYNPLKPPREVISMYGILEIKPSILQEYINELYNHR